MQAPHYQAYIEKEFRPDTIRVIDQANDIIREYQQQYSIQLTLRQLYYQFVARGLIPNKDTEYKRLGSIINDARLAGLVDWHALQDMTRNLASLSHWTSPSEIMRAVANQYHEDMWKGQTYRPEVWIEKDALVNTIQNVCEEFDVPYFSCRGYTSQTEMWKAGQRLLAYHEDGYTPIILHLGDHDPSGIDMSRDIFDRLDLFMGVGMDVQRLALNFDQVQQYGPPPNPAKFTDSRSTTYVRRFGLSSWELDALPPQVIAALIRDAIGELIDEGPWDEARAQIEEQKRILRVISNRWTDVAEQYADVVDTCQYRYEEQRCDNPLPVDSIDLLGNTCAGCRKVFCDEHVVPEWHDCSGEFEDA